MLMPDFPGTESKLRMVLTEYLESGESVRWYQSPDPAAFARRARGLRLFSILWLGFIALWTLIASQGSVLFAAFSIPFWIVGIWMATAPTRERNRAGCVLYAITNQRAIILDAHKGRSIRSFYGADLNDITLVEREGDRVIWCSSTICRGTPTETRSSRRSVSLASRE